MKKNQFIDLPAALNRYYICSCARAKKDCCKCEKIHPTATKLYSWFKQKYEPLGDFDKFIDKFSKL